ncbi:uncharacterized protein [Castor canadensis]|uniref:Uncharacterized protein n=1 Tax=Castor canadensis TaxID=51338 RepID=A0AC58LMM1_CASCN
MPEMLRFHVLKNCKILAFLCTIIALVLGIIIEKSTCWRVWEFHSHSVHIVFIGFWEAYYCQVDNITGSLVECPIHTTVNESWIIPPELYYGKDLILLANFMKLVVLTFMMDAAFVYWINVPHPDFHKSCDNYSVLLLLLSSCSTMIAVTWNLAMEFYGQTTLEFPGNFPVTKEALRKKYLAYVFPLGMLTSTISLFVVTILVCKRSSMNRRRYLYRRYLAKHVLRKG